MDVWSYGLPKVLREKIKKTGYARYGNGIYKRRLRRDYRVIMHLNTYITIINSDPGLLSKFKEGYAIRLTPEEYFTNENELKNKGVILGKNAFVYYKSIKSFKKYPPSENWQPVYELRAKTIGDEVGWIGHYALNINNTSKLNLVSPICQKKYKMPIEYKKNLIEAYQLLKVPQQAGLGNFDYDYADKDEVDKIKAQMTNLIYKTSNIDQVLWEKFLEDPIDYNLSLRFRNDLLKNNIRANIIRYITENSTLVAEKSKEFKLTIDLKKLLESDIDVLWKKNENVFNQSIEEILTDYTNPKKKSEEKDNIAIKLLFVQMIIEYIRDPKNSVEAIFKEKLASYKTLLEVECAKLNLWDEELLKSKRIISTEGKPICPLCLDELNCIDFLERDLQDEGRLEEDNTRAKIALMHIDPLKSGKFNHRTNNLGWGHRHCNTIQEDISIDEALLKIKEILIRNQMWS